MPQGVPGDVVVINETDDGDAVFEQVVKGFGPLGKVAVEQRTWADAVLALTKYSGGAELVSATPLTNPLRRVKSDDEIQRMQHACRIADNAMGVVTTDIADGAVERDLVEELDGLLHGDGSRGTSFDTAVWGMGKSTTVTRPIVRRAPSSTVAPGSRSISVPSSTGTARTSVVRSHSVSPTRSTSTSMTR